MRRGAGALAGTTQWARRAKTRLKLAAAEWRERGQEWRERAPDLARRRLLDVQGRWRHANKDFDTWFNAQFREQSARMRKRLSGEGASAPPIDMFSAMLLGAGAGGVMQGYLAAGALAAGCGTARVAARYVGQRVEANDIQGLFRYAPTWLRARQNELWSRLRAENAAAKRLRRYEKRDVDLSWIDYGEHPALDPKNDYTPEKLFETAMKSLASHSRVRDVCGDCVRVAHMPDKVVHRHVGGVPEVFLGWRIAGDLGAADIQCKSSASLLDFIYVFPDGQGRYGLKPDGFVIRPQGDWSQDCSELPSDMKKPFGDHKGRPIYQRDSVFEYDYDVREFRHGYENGRFRPWERPWRGRGT